MTDAVNPLGRFDLPFAEQIDFFRRKTNLGTQTWTDIWEAQHDRAFVVAGAMKADLLDEIRQAVDKAIATGTTLETFRKEFRDITDRLGWPGTAGAGEQGRVQLADQGHLRDQPAHQLRRRPRGAARRPRPAEAAAVPALRP